MLSSSGFLCRFGYGNGSFDLSGGRRTHNELSEIMTSELIGRIKALVKMVSTSPIAGCVPSSEEYIAMKT